MTAPLSVVAHAGLMICLRLTMVAFGFWDKGLPFALAPSPIADHQAIKSSTRYQ
jgi:hypothetical protein